MICPQCAAEYREGHTICTTCQIALIEGESQYDFDPSEGTPAIIVGLLIAVSIVAVYAMRVMEVSWYWALPVVGLAFVVYLIRRRHGI